VKKIYIVSLGCPKNLVDSEVAVSKFLNNNYELVFDETKADIVLINTCAFLKSAIEESDSVINHYLKLKKEKKIESIIVLGCLVERLKKKLILKYPEIDAVFGVGAYDMIDDFLKNKGRYFVKDYNKRINFEDRTLLTMPHSAYLKIADGCDNFCSYCTIPLIRGRFRSQKMEEVIEEAKALVGSGVKEISLIAQDTTNYGLDLYSKPKLKELLKGIEKIKGLKWIRLMYLYPSSIDLELIKMISQSSKILHYIEMPLQHISDRILKLMNRKYDSKAIYNTIDNIKKHIPDMALRTTYIVGFPEETDKDFKELLKFNSYARFNSLSVFKYSKEKDTKAYNMKQVGENIKNERYEEIIRSQSEIVDEFNRKIIGRRFKVLFDTPFTARSYMDAPDIDGRFEIVKGKHKTGEFGNIKVLEAKGYVRRGVLV